MSKALRLITHLKEKQIDIEVIEYILREIFEMDANILQNVSPFERSDIRGLICIYDYLK